MAKAGDEYQDLVALVAGALHPTASITVGEWVLGPDGRRELDVAVRSPSGEPVRLVLIECKDWKDPVGIEEIDKLESKRRDLHAEKAVICSNSGFTRNALRKADRVGIFPVSALIAGNTGIRYQAYRRVFAKRLSVDQWKLTIFPTADSARNVPQIWDPRDLRYSDLPVVNWLSKISRAALEEHQTCPKIEMTCAFREATAFVLAGKPVVLAGLKLLMTCSSNWLSRIVREDVTAGLYDHIRSHVVIPNNQAYMVGPFDQSDWEEEADEPHDPYGKAGPVRFWLTLFNQIAPVKGFETPNLDELIGETRLDAS
jgi:Restriction endonuclease